MLSKKWRPFWLGPNMSILLKPLWHSNAMWRHTYGSTLAQIMDFCLMVLSHYLDQSWLFISFCDIRLWVTQQLQNWLFCTWWRHQMETFCALLALCAGNSPVTGEFPAQGPVTRNFDVFFDLRLNKRLSKQSGGWWFEMPSRSLWRHCNENGFENYTFKIATASPRGQ